MSSYVKLVIMLHVMLAAGAPDPRSYPNAQELDYLTSFGYLPDMKSEQIASLVSGEQLISAIKNLQSKGGIPVTGKIDEETKELMVKKRCGMPDNDPFGRGNSRQKRFLVHGLKWHHHNLTWSLRSRDLEGLDRYQVRDALRRALDLWAQNSKLTFTEVYSDTADILVSFERGKHGDDYPFDGKGKILAHAFFPGPDRGGDAHFDKDEIWLLDDDPTKDGTSLFAVAAHEFGHSLGLAHSSEKGALMYPWYQGISKNYQLPEDDRLGIQVNYDDPKRRKWGDLPTYTPTRYPPPRRTTTTTTTTTTHRPYPRTHHPNQGPYEPRKYPDCYPNKPSYGNRCPPYHTPYYPARNTPRPPHRPRLPTTPRTSDVPDTCDTSYDAITMISRETFIFKGRYFWRIGKNGIYAGFPAEFHRFFNLPTDVDHVDAVYERSRDRRIVFFVGRKYYVFHGNLMEAGYPRPLTDLGLPSTLEKIDGAMVWGHNGFTYFFSGHQYWRFDEYEGRVQLDYPRDMSVFAGVDYNIDAVFQWSNGKTYFFKGKGYWEFNDLRMRVAHKRQKPSATFLMGCTKVPDVEGDVDDNQPRQGRVTSAGHRSPVLALSVLLAISVILRLS